MVKLAGVAFPIGIPVRICQEALIGHPFRRRLDSIRGPDQGQGHGKDGESRDQRLNDGMSVCSASHIRCDQFDRVHWREPILTQW